MSRRQRREARRHLELLQMYRRIAEALEQIRRNTDPPPLPVRMAAPPTTPTDIEFAYYETKWAAPDPATRREVR